MLIGSGSGLIGRRTVFVRTGSVETCAATAVEPGGWICVGGANAVCGKDAFGRARILDFGAGPGR